MIVGMLIGGAAALFQRDLVKIMGCLARREWLQAEKHSIRMIKTQDREKYTDIRKLSNFVELIPEQIRFLITVLFHIHFNQLKTILKVMILQIKST
jgi:hypothetical protein